MKLRDSVARTFSLLGLAAVALAAALSPGHAAAQDGIVAALTAPAGADQAAPAATFSVYLPSLRRTGPTPPPPPPPPPPTDGAFFFTKELKTISSVAKVDGQGRMHVVLNSFVSYSENPRAIYGFCTSLVPAECLKESSWSFVALENQSDGVELDLTADGKPRVLIRQKQLNNTTTDYIYGECDSGCDKIENWGGTAVVNSAENQLFAADEPQRAFALDPQGRPRFIFGNGWGNGQPDGIFYMACDDDCANQANWSKTPIYEGPEDKTLGINYPSLAFTSDGRPRAVGMMSLSGLDAGLLYFECDAGCEDQSGWTALAVDSEGRYASWDIEVDARDQVHLALSGRITLDPLPAGGRLEYRTCADNCANKASWRSGALSLQGQYVDLELDRQGRPRVAYGTLNASGVAYGWCDTSCTQAGQWRNEMVDTASQMQREFTVPHPITCEPSAWLQFTPSLALDPNGNPRIAFDALNGSKCWYDNDPNDNIPPQSKIEKLFRAVRWVIATK